MQVPERSRLLQDAPEAQIGAQEAPLTVSPAHGAAPAHAGDEAVSYIQAYGVPDIVEVLLPDTSGVLRGKWIPGQSMAKIWESGVAIPLSIFGLDIWGCEVEATEIHLETGDKDGPVLARAWHAEAGALVSAPGGAGAHHHGMSRTAAPGCLIRASNWPALSNASRRSA